MSGRIKTRRSKDRESRPLFKANIRHSPNSPELMVTKLNDKFVVVDKHYKILLSDDTYEGVISQFSKDKTLW